MSARAASCRADSTTLDVYDVRSLKLVERVQFDAKSLISHRLAIRQMVLSHTLTLSERSHIACVYIRENILARKSFDYLR